MPKPLTVEQALDTIPRLRERSDALDMWLMKTTALHAGFISKADQARDQLHGAEADLRTLHQDYGHLPRVDDRDDPGSEKRNGVLPLSVIDEREAKVTAARDELNKATVSKNRIASDKANAAHYITARDDYLPHAVANGGLTAASARTPRGADVGAIRTEWMELRKERKAVENSVRPVTTEDIRHIVESRAESARLIMSPRGNLLIKPPIVRVAAEPASAGNIPNAPDALALMCRYVPEVVVADMTEQARRLAGERLVLSLKRRPNVWPTSMLKSSDSSELRRHWCGRPAHQVKTLGSQRASTFGRSLASRALSQKPGGKQFARHWGARAFGPDSLSPWRARSVP